MIVKFEINLGSNDAAGLSLDHTKCCEGMACDVSDAAGKSLVARKWATEIPAEKTKAQKSETKSEPKPSESADTTKPTK